MQKNFSGAMFYFRFFLFYYTCPRSIIRRLYSKTYQRCKQPSCDHGDSQGLPIKEKIQAKDDGIVVVGDITQALKAQQSGERKTSLFIQRAVFSFVGEPTTSMIQGDEHKPYYYHIRTPLREKDGRMYRYDLNCYAYGEARAFSALYVGYLFAGWNKQAGAPIVNAYSTYSGSKSPQKKFKTSQYIGRDRHLYLKFGPINRYVLQCVLHSQGLTGGERGKYSAFTRKDNGNDTPYPEQ